MTMEGLFPTPPRSWPKAPPSSMLLLFLFLLLLVRRSLLLCRGLVALDSCSWLCRIIDDELNINGFLVGAIVADGLLIELSRA
ncbi:MAG: hypothetical protein JOS17DRAFT_731187 [Linnemannia elongata]|nr:MAG: hypothetical protein JOS17DRAFT_731187 [Linnemannia elongata]